LDRKFGNEVSHDSILPFCQKRRTLEFRVRSVVRTKVRRFLFDHRTVKQKQELLNHPEFLEFRVNVDAVDQTNASDDTVFIATELPVHECDFSGVVFVEHAVFTNQISVGADHDFLFALLPDLIGFDAIFPQVPCGCVVTESLVVLDEVRERPKPIRCCRMGQEVCNWFDLPARTGNSRSG
jgi:hypothetical protein